MASLQKLRQKTLRLHFERNKRKAKSRHERPSRQLVSFQFVPSSNTLLNIGFGRATTPLHQSLLRVTGGQVLRRAQPGEAS
jgi:hypothetical protein